MNDHDVDRTMLIAGAAATAWGLAQIRRTAPRLFAFLALLFSLAVSGLLLWFSVNLFHYMLTTPACQQQGTCVVSRQPAGGR